AFIAMRNYIMSTRSIEAELSALRARLQLLERADEEIAFYISFWLYKATKKASLLILGSLKVFIDF
ncbi:MAG: hypothetical protein IKA12_01830, partial [Clostridia bacterium]|nr:hypothetical protein [Clostridia bacterium]